ncbi:MAG: Excinuclease ABC C subunit domain protein [Parcubacteria group bacterium GW2011_GWC2_42_12]|nr:MAG: Excinuclease ABC C subunit domain protein [Parcubacteria group bacterium GW2011_GWC2_42_12]
MTLENIKQLNIPTTPGCYQFYNGKGEIIYIGKAANLQNRVFSYWQKSASHTPAKNKMLTEIKKITWVVVDSEIEALLLEANLIKKYQPYYNVLLRDDKRFAYIKISTDDEIPGVFITRQIDKSGKYFGPFISSLAARETIRAIRKVWPYCNTRKAQTRPCFYYQIGRCLGICAGRITRQEYLEQVIKPLSMFLEGKKGKIIKKLEVRIKKLEQEEGIRNYELGSREEELVKLKFELKNMKQVLENAKVLSLGEKYANDVVEMAKVLSLPKIPVRIEGYDIANIFGREAVGAMIVFKAGEPDKDEYRKFKIKIGQGEANDSGMLKEVLERRFKHGFTPLKKGGKGGLKEVADAKFVKDKIPLAPFVKGGKEQRWPLPDLIIVDGGKAQLNAVSRVLKKRKLGIPLIAISKGLGLRSSGAPDRLFFPGQTKPLELPLASPALHLIKRVRDEAHRFAIGYHRKLRSRAKFE